MSKDDNTYSFGQAFQKFLKDEELHQKFNEKKLVSMWNDMMGTAIANRTSSIFIKEKIMYVKLTSAPLKQEMTMAKQKVLSLLEDHLGEKVVKDVRFL